MVTQPKNWLFTAPLIACARPGVILGGGTGEGHSGPSAASFGGSRR